MWGNIIAEVTYQPNFNIDFCNTKSDVLIHLSQWQYWWWFWFCFVWVLYFFIILRIVRFRTLKFRPRVASTFRPHGKWGDLLVCVLPISWCVNILINSNFLLKLIEWQNESSLFTVRVRGKQWYWVYKYDIKGIADILSVPKNIGRNKWVVASNNMLSTSDCYLESIKLRFQAKWYKKYWVESSNKFTRGANSQYFTNVGNLEKNNHLKANLPAPTALGSLLSSTKSISTSFSLLPSGYSNIFSNISFNALSAYLENTQFNASIANFVNTGQGSSTFLSHSDFIDNSRFFKKANATLPPLQIVSTPSTKIKETGNLFLLHFSDTSDLGVHKNTPSNAYLTLKQKRYSRRKNISYRSQHVVADSGVKTTTVKRKSKPVLDNNIIFDSSCDLTKKYRFFKKSKLRYDETNVVFNKRLLRTSRTLVLPAHINITAVTNSYDVIHSWFIPGLGLKMDCVPGRSTHHTFYIDNVGFYYGQCAEVCGRYHHHMPIRICALPFEHFLVWWHTFGLNKALFVPAKKKLSTTYGFKKYLW